MFFVWSYDYELCDTHCDIKICSNTRVVPTPPIIDQGPGGLERPKQCRWHDAVRRSENLLRKGLYGGTGGNNFWYS